MVVPIQPSDFAVPKLSLERHEDSLILSNLDDVGAIDTNALQPLQRHAHHFPSRLWLVEWLNKSERFSDSEPQWTGIDYHSGWQATQSIAQWYRGRTL